MKKYQLRGRTEYPAVIKFAYATGIEELVVPFRVRQEIARSTRAAWRKLDQKEWLQYYDIEVEVLDLIQRLKKGGETLVSRRMVRRAYRAALEFRRLIGEDKFFRLIRENKRALLSMADQAREVFGLRSTLRFLGITPRQYRDWKIELKFDCIDSINSLCVKRHSNQLHAKEIRIIENALNDLAYAHWPLSAIHDQLRLEGKLYICRSTFYKYARMLGDGQARRAFTKPKKKGLRAKAPNEIWHIDIVTSPIIRLVLNILPFDYNS